MRATYGNGLADHQEITASRDHGEKCETGQIRGRFLRDIHARRRLLLQHRVRDDDGDGADRRQSERTDAPAALSLVQQVRGCPIQPGERNRANNAAVFMFHSKLYHCRSLQPGRRFCYACVRSARYFDLASRQTRRR